MTFQYYKMLARAIRVFAIYLQASYNIKYLDLSHNEFGEAAGEILGPAIGT